MYSLFQIMTLESWSMGIVRVVMQEWSYAWCFFISWIIITSYGILNLLASIFVEKILESKEKVCQCQCTKANANPNANLYSNVSPNAVTVS